MLICNVQAIGHRPLAQVPTLILAVIPVASLMQRWADMEDDSDDEFIPAPSDLQQTLVIDTSPKGLINDTSELFECASLSKNKWRKWYVALLVPLDFSGEYMDSIPNILQYLEEHQWRGTLFTKPGSFLGAMSFFVAPLCRAVVKQSNSFKGFEQIQFCAAAFSGEVPDGIMVLHCRTSTCLLFEVGQQLRTVSLKYLIFCAALKKRMAFIIHIDDEYAPLFFPTKMYYHLQWTKKGQTRWCYLR